MTGCSNFFNWIISEKYLSSLFLLSQLRELGNTELISDGDWFQNLSLIQYCFQPIVHSHMLDFHFQLSGERLKESLFAWGFPKPLSCKESALVKEIWVHSLGQEDPLEEEMATHCSISASIIPWTEESCGLQSMGSQRVKYDLLKNKQTKRKAVEVIYELREF